MLFCYYETVKAIVPINELIFRYPYVRGYRLLRSTIELEEFCINFCVFLHITKAISGSVVCGRTNAIREVIIVGR